MITAQSGDLRIAVTDWGGPVSPSGAAPPLLFVHATGFCAGVWRRVVGHFPDRRCFGYDQRGHGASSKPEDPAAYDWERFADDCLAVLDDLGVERCDGVGHSSGAATLVLAATRVPERFRRLVLFEPIIAPPLTEESPLRSAGRFGLAEGARRRRMVFDSPDQMLARFAEKPPFDTWEADCLADYVRCGSFTRPDGQQELRCPGHVEAMMYDQSVHHRGYEALTDLTCPALVLSASDTFAVTPPYAEHLASLVPGGHFGVVPGCGHFAPMERPDLFAQLAADFLRGGEQAPPHGPPLP